MKHKPAMYALLRLHAEIGGKLLDNRTQAERLAQDMKHVEAVIRMFEPGFDVTKIAARRRYNANPIFRRGEGFRAAIDVLRTAGEPLTVRELARLVLAAHGVADPSFRSYRTMEAALRASLKNHVGKTVNRVGAGMPSRWKLSPLAGE